MKWYYEKNDEPQGPFSLEDILPVITPDTLVWRENSLEDWIAASDHPNLATIFKGKIEEENSPTINKENEAGDKSLIIKSIDKLADSNLELIRKADSQSELNKKQDEKLKANEKKIKQLEQEKILLEATLISTKKQKEDEIKTLAKEKQLLENKYSESAENAEYLSSKVIDYKQKLDSNNNKHIFDTYITSKTNDGYSIIKKDDDRLTAEIFKKDGKDIPKKPLDLGKIYLVFLFLSAIGIISFIVSHEIYGWYEYTNEGSTLNFILYDAHANWILFVAGFLFAFLIIRRYIIREYDKIPILKEDITIYVKVVNGKIVEDKKY